MYLYCIFYAKVVFGNTIYVDEGDGNTIVHITQVVGWEYTGTQVIIFTRMVLCNIILDVPAYWKRSLRFVFKTKSTTSERGCPFPM